MSAPRAAAQLFRNSRRSVFIDSRCPLHLWLICASQGGPIQDKRHSDVVAGGWRLDYSGNAMPSLKRSHWNSNMPIRAFLIAAVLSLEIQHAIRADYYIDLRFGPLVVIGEQVVFSDLTANGLVCVSRKTGAKEWEINKDRDFFHPLTTSGGELLVLSHKRISRCDPATGSLSLVYQAHSELSVVGPFHGDQLLVELRWAETKFLVSLDLNTFRERWRRPIVKLVACSSDTVFVVEGKPPLKPLGGFRGSNTHLLAIDHAGRLKWKASFPEQPDQLGYWYLDGLVVDSHLLVSVAKTGLGLIELQCLRSEDGKVTGSREFGQTANTGSMAECLGSISFAEFGTNAVAWASYGHFEARSNVVYSVTVPNLEVQPLFQTERAAHVAAVQGNSLIGWNGDGVIAFDVRSGKKLWQASLSKFCGIYQGLVYCSTGDARRWSANGILDINPETGQQRVLFSRMPFPGSKDRHGAAEPPVPSANIQ